MLARTTSRILANFGRLHRLKTSQYDNVFEMAQSRQRSTQFIHRMNDHVLNTNKFTPQSQILSQQLNIPQKYADQVNSTVLQFNAYSPYSYQGYRVTQKINGQPQTDNIGEVELKYQPGNLNLKFHASINAKVARLSEYKIKDNQVFVFNLPEDITQKKLATQIGSKLIKNLQIKYCMLGLPAYAIIQFNNDKWKQEPKFKNGNVELNLDTKTGFMFTKQNQNKLALNRRQLVIKDITQNVTPAQMLLQLSKFGRIMHINVPMQIYKQPSLEQIKKAYKNEPTPISLNFIRQNGTQQSEYYPPFERKAFYDENLETREEAYQRRLKFSENVNVYEGRAGQIDIVSKGYCIVTFSCQEEAQNCYFHLRTTQRIQLLNEREQFEFDQAHYRSLLRFIDNSFLEQSVNGDPSKEVYEKLQKLSNFRMQNTFMQLTYYQNLFRFYNDGREVMFKTTPATLNFRLHMIYKRFLNQFKESIGRGHIEKENSLAAGNLYGKSFDDLAEEELYGMKLEERKNQPRYQVSLNAYTHQKNFKELVFQKHLEMVKYRREKRFQRAREARLARQLKRQEEQESARQVKIPKAHEEALRLKRLAEQNKTQFSSGRIQNSGYFRPKTLQEKVKSHIRYNAFVRDTINQYLGIFPLSKMESQFYRKKPTFANPQNLRLMNGEDFLPEEDISRVLQFAGVEGQQTLDQFIKQNQWVKSTSYDIQQNILKSLKLNKASALHQMTDIGEIQQQYEVDENVNVQQTVKQLNEEAQFGESYKIVSDEQGNKKIVKLAKLQNIYPLDLLDRLNKELEKSDQTEQNPELQKAIMESFEKGKPLPDKFTQMLDVPKGTIVDINFAMPFFQQSGFTKKEIQKLLNSKNYTQQQINVDISKQKQLYKVREKIQPRKASDYTRDPSQIKTRDRSGRAVVSKFRQV